MSITVDYEGRGWVMETPTPAFALRVRRITELQGRDLIVEVRGEVMDAMGLDDWCEFHRLERIGELPDDAIIEVFMRWLETSCGKPMSAVVTLCHIMVRSWPVVRGRLVTSGLPDPLGQIKTLAAMLDAVEFMVREGHKDDKEAEKWEREVYKPRAKQGTVEKPSGFEADDLAAQGALLSALGGD